ncbi:DUF998 domain-containing protein [Stenotrophomonas sp. MYb238]|uniref:DUF998 domain-containing protein n=1 Tax=Stenotrophomonas sp. MYb238 TaxID=2040281 RepID=UPI001291AECF|nr:DUF998 domain-containing protein [Stenotrophomonas sp. MYb238]MQP74413.1 DUF998 domain-containing protein [Stenotrophomonas sp. MYb238]
MGHPRRIVVLFALAYLGMLFGGALLKPGYSHAAQYISELGASGSAHARLISVAGFVPVGLIAAWLLAATARFAPVGGASRLGYWLLLCEPLAWIGSALAPCDLGCPPGGSISQQLHTLLGVFTYGGTALGLLLLATAPRLRSGFRLLWIALAAAWLLLFVLMATPELAPWRGLLQRLAEWLVYGALCVAAWRLGGAARGESCTRASAART